jgi:ribosomal-protein-alanine N-acetyltransferase
MKFPSYTLQRLTLRAFSEADTEPMYRILTGKDVLRYFPSSKPPTVDGVRRIVKGMINHWDEHGYGLWALESRSDGELIGRCGLQYLPDTDEVEVDFILGREHWGQGYATEAGSASIDYGFKELKVDFIVGIVHPKNIASQRVLEKIGMQFIEQTQYFNMECYRYTIKRSWYGIDSDLKNPPDRTD